MQVHWSEMGKIIKQEKERKIEEIEFEEEYRELQPRDDTNHYYDQESQMRSELYNDGFKEKFSLAKWIAYAVVVGLLIALYFVIKQII